MNKRLRPIIAAAAAALAVLAVGTIVPVWTVMTRSAIVEGDNRRVRLDYRGGPLWTMAAPGAEQGPFRRQNLLQGAIIASIAIGLGLLVYRATTPRMRPDSADDYEEKPDGSIPDRRE